MEKDLGSVATPGSELSKSEETAHTKSSDDQQLENAASIGTSLMLVNSHRALFIMYVLISAHPWSMFLHSNLLPFVWTIRMSIMCLLPALYAGLTRNPVSRNQVQLLQANNVASNTTDDCEYLFNAVQSWVYSAMTIQTNSKVIGDAGDIHLLWAQLLPVRCIWQRNNGVISACDLLRGPPTIGSFCEYWNETTTSNPSKEYFAESIGVRPGGILDVAFSTTAPSGFLDNVTVSEFYVRAVYNESHSIALA